jgi:hypothetical protein
LQIESERRCDSRRAASPSHFQFSIFNFPFVFCAFLTALFLAQCGCASYRFGSDALFRPDITTVRVTMFENDSFRRDLGERLTEAVCKEIEARGGMKVVQSPAADSTLVGRIIDDRKAVVSETRNDDPRDLAISLEVQVTWVDRQGGVIQEGPVAVPPALLSLNQSSNMIPEVGQSMATTQQEAIEDLAARIVSQMERPW